MSWKIKKNDEKELCSLHWYSKSYLMDFFSFDAHIFSLLHFGLWFLRCHRMTSKLQRQGQHEQVGSFCIQRNQIAECKENVCVWQMNKRWSKTGESLKQLWMLEIASSLHHFPSFNMALFGFCILYIYWW